MLIDFHSFSFRFPSAETSIFVLLFISKCKENSKRSFHRFLKVFSFLNAPKNSQSEKQNFVSKACVIIFHK